MGKLGDRDLRLYAERINAAWVNRRHDQRRLEANREILRLLSEYLETHPSLRFTQALYNLGLAGDERYNEEPWTTLERARSTIEN